MTCLEPNDRSWYLLEDRIGPRSDQDYNDLFMRTTQLQGLVAPTEATAGTAYTATMWEGLKTGSWLDHELLVILSGLVVPYLIAGPIVPENDDWDTVPYNCVLERIGPAAENDTLPPIALTGATPSANVQRYFLALPSTEAAFRPPELDNRPSSVDAYWAGTPTCRGVGGYRLAMRLNGFFTNNPDHPDWSDASLGDRLQTDFGIRVKRTGAVFVANKRHPDAHPMFRETGQAIHLARISDGRDDSFVWRPVPKGAAVFPGQYGEGSALVAQLSHGVEPAAFAEPSPALMEQFAPAARSSDWATLYDELTTGCP